MPIDLPANTYPPYTPSFSPDGSPICKKNLKMGAYRPGIDDIRRIPAYLTIRSCEGFFPLGNVSRYPTFVADKRYEEIVTNAFMARIEDSAEWEAVFSLLGRGGFPSSYPPALTFFRNTTINYEPDYPNYVSELNFALVVDDGSGILRPYDPWGPNPEDPDTPPSDCDANACRVDCADAPNGFCCIPHSLIDRLSKSLRG
jgi:hypothetical protein